MSKSIWIGSALFLACVVAAFAGGQQGTKTAGLTTVTVTAPGVFPIVEGDPVTLKVFMDRQRAVKDYSYDENAFTKWYTDKTNVRVDFQLIESDVTQKMNVMLASRSDLPDIFMTSIGSEIQMSYGPQGILLPLNEYIQNLGFGIKRLIEYETDALKQMSMPDGKIYAMTRYNECYHCSYAQRAYINQGWLDRLGLKMPDTVDDLYRVLRAFKTQDPNGNGLSDEIPMSASERSWYSASWGFIAEAFIYHNGQYGRMINNVRGTFVPVYIQPEWREMIRYMRRLYNEGLFYDTVFTQDAAQFRQEVMHNPPIVGVIMTGGVNVPVDAADKARFRMYEQAIPPLTGPSGVKRAMYRPFNFSPSGAITSACRNPEVAFRWLDGFLMEDVTFRSFYGLPGHDWREPIAGEVGFDGKPAIFTMLIPWGTDTTTSWMYPGVFFWPDKYRTGEGGKPGAYNPQKNLYVDTKTYYEPFADPEGVRIPANIVFTLEEIEEKADIEAAINDYWRQSLAQFITGQMSVENDWGAYLRQLEALQLQKYVAMVQKAYERQYK